MTKILYSIPSNCLNYPKNHFWEGLFLPSRHLKNLKISPFGPNHGGPLGRCSGILLETQSYRQNGPNTKCLYEPLHNKRSTAVETSRQMKAAVRTDYPLIYLFPALELHSHSISFYHNGCRYCIHFISNLYTVCRIIYGEILQEPFIRFTLRNLNYCSEMFQQFHFPLNHFLENLRMSHIF